MKESEAVGVASRVGPARWFAVALLAIISEWPVLAANATHHVEIRCVDSLACAPVLVDRVTGVVSDLPIELTDNYGSLTIAPDGGHILMVNPTTGASYPDLFYDVAADELVALAHTVSGSVAWSPDSTIVA